MDLSKTLDKVFLVLPNYCLGQCISDFYQNYEFIQFCTSSVEAIFICKAFSESPCPHLANPNSLTGGLCGVRWNWAVSWGLYLGSSSRYCFRAKAAQHIRTYIEKEVP